MAYLSLAMDAVLTLVQAEHAAAERSESFRRQEEELKRRKYEEDLKATEDIERAKVAFELAYPDPNTRDLVIARYAEEFPFLDPSGPLVRNLAIGSWWQREGRA
jgi:hypothetical protein